MPVEKGKKHHRKVLQRHVLENPKNHYQKRRPVIGFKHTHLLHGYVPAHTSLIVMAFLKKEKVTFLPHLSYSVDLALCDVFMFPKLK